MNPQVSEPGCSAADIKMQVIHNDFFSLKIFGMYPPPPYVSKKIFHLEYLVLFLDLGMVYPMETLSLTLS